MISVLLAACVAVPTCSVTLTTNCATPTPTIQWDGVAHSDLAGYRIYAQEAGGPLTLIATLPCEWRDLFTNDDEVPDGRFQVCAGVDWPVPIQRFTDQSRSYDLTVFAYTTSWLRSVDPSNMVNICTPPIYQIGSRLPYN